MHESYTKGGALFVAVIVFNIKQMKNIEVQGNIICFSLLPKNSICCWGVDVTAILFGMIYLPAPPEELIWFFFISKHDS